MDSRKIQTVGGGTYTVSLPKAWAESHSLEAGATVDLHTHRDGVLVVEAREPDDAIERVRISVDDVEPEPLEQSFRAAYAAGASAVRFEANEGFSDAQRRRIETVARTMTGVTIVDETAEAITVRALLDPTEVSIGQSVRQLSFVALSMHRDAVAGLSTDRGVGLGDRDEQADRLAAMVDRHVCRAVARLDEVDALGQSRPELLDLSRTAHELERIADHAGRIADAATTVEAPAPETVDALEEIAQTAQGVAEDAVRVVVDGADVETARAALRVRDRLRDRTEALERRDFAAGDTDYRLVRVLDSLRRTAEHGGNVAEIGLRAAVRNGKLARPVAGQTDDDDEHVDTATDTSG